MTRFAYSLSPNQPNILMPRLSVILSYQGRSIEALGLVDSGAAVSVLPYQIGHTLGANWDDDLVDLQLTGALGRFEAKALFVDAIVPQVAMEYPVELAFAWSRAENIPLVLGQTNFFKEFDVYFYGSEDTFEVTRKQRER